MPAGPWQNRWEPIFCQTLLETLHNKGSLVLDRETCLWKWDLDEIRSKNITDNLIALLGGRIRTLNQGMSETLVLAAALGHRFDLALLARAAGKPSLEMVRGLWSAVENRRIGGFVLIANRNRIPRRSETVVLDPTLDPAHAQNILDADFYPPARMGDIYRLVAVGIQIYF